MAHKRRNRTSPIGTFTAWCDEHQKRYYTKKQAQAEIRLAHETGLRRYRCDVFSTVDVTFFHIGHMPITVRRGYRTARQHYELRRLLRGSDFENGENEEDL